MMGCMCICILCYVNRGTIYGYYDILNYVLIEARLYDTRCYQVRWLNLGFLSEKTWGIAFVNALTNRPRTPTTTVCSSCNFKNIELCIHLSLPIFTVYIDVISEYRLDMSDVLPTLASLGFFCQCWRVFWSSGVRKWRMWMPLKILMMWIKRKLVLKMPGQLHTGQMGNLALIINVCIYWWGRNSKLYN